VTAVGFNWAAQPDYFRVFIFYLFLAGAITIWYSGHLFYRLYFARLGTPRREIFNGSASPIHVARAGLAHDLAPAFRAIGSHQTTNPKLAALVPGEAKSEFDFLWDVCNSRAIAIERLSKFTLLLAFIVFAGGAFPTWSAEFDSSDVPGSVALFRSTHILFVRLAWGLAVSATFYGLSSVFLAVLRRRRRCWRYFCDQEDRPKLDVGS
jgi:hypothetical protein